MNYRHAFHAGNFADVAKHLALVAVLNHLACKDKPFAVIDSHAGAGAYDLASPTAARTGEAESGVLRLQKLVPKDPLLADYLSHCRGTVYPGSPLIAAQHIRAQDRLVAIERHADTAEALAAVLHPFFRARTECADGYDRLGTLLPPPERRALVLIDPPFEEPDEFRQCARAFARAYRKFATGIYLLWFPVKSASEADRFAGEVLAAGVARALRIDAVLDPAPEDRLARAGLIVVNPPYGFEAQMRASLAEALPVLGAQAEFTLLAGEKSAPTA